jgi:ornithine carbamoyltransferase
METADRATLPHQVNMAMMCATGKARSRFLHCLPACHNP